MDMFIEMLQDNKKKVMIGAIGVIAVVVAAVIVTSSKGGNNVPVVDESMAVYGLIDISEGETITEDMIGTREPNNDELDVDTFSDMSSVIGSTALSEVEEGQLIKVEDVKILTDDGGFDDHLPNDYNSMGSDLSSMVPKGLRAVLMPTGDVQEMVNFLNIGDRIDLVVTHVTIEGFETTTPFKNIEVLMLDNSTPKTSDVENEEGAYDNELMSGGTSVILAMSPEDAESILNMRLSGALETVQITLRSIEDSE